MKKIFFISFLSLLFPVFLTQAQVLEQEQIASLSLQASTLSNIVEDLKGRLALLGGTPFPPPPPSPSPCLDQPMGTTTGGGVPCPPPLPPQKNGSIVIKRVGKDLTTTTVPATKAQVDNLPPSAANPASFPLLSEGIHTALFTDSPLHSEKVGICFYASPAARGGVPPKQCGVSSTFPITPFCNGSLCNLSVNVYQNVATKIVVQYLPLQTLDLPLTPGSVKPVRGDLSCPAIYDPVCGVDGKTYGSACNAGIQDIKIAHKGECTTPAVKTPGGVN